MKGWGWYRRYIVPAAILSATIIGAGFFALPYVVSQVGLLPAILYALLGLFVYTLLHLMLADIILGTKADHRFPGYVRMYLGKLAGRLAYVVVVGGAMLAMTIYLVLAQSFTNLFGVLPVPVSGVFIFWFLGSLTIFLNVRRFGFLESVLTTGILAIIGILFARGTQGSMLQVPLIGTGALRFAPLAPILFSISGVSAIYLVIEYFKASKEKQIRQGVVRAIALGTLVPMLAYGFFVWGVFGLTPHITPDAVSGLLGFIPAWLLVAVGALGVLALWSSYIAIGFNLRDIFIHDFHFHEWPALFIVVLAPLFLFMAGFKDFLTLVSIVGGVFLSFEGMLVLRTWQVFRRKQGSYLLPRLGTISLIIGYATFIFALAAEIFR